MKSRSLHRARYPHSSRYYRRANQLIDALSFAAVIAVVLFFILPAVQMWVAGLAATLQAGGR